MSELERLQSAFCAYITRRDPAMLEHVVGTAAAGAAERLEIYRQAYRLRLREALQKDFPGLHGLLGDAQFAALADAYIDACPSQHPSLRWFGRHLADFLSDADPYRGQGALAELARFEWAQGEVFDGPGGTPASLADLAAIAPERWAELRLVLQPTVRQLALAWNVPEVWQALDREETPPPLHPVSPAVTWLMWRRGLQPHWRSLDVDEAWALGEAAAGARFGEICEGLQAWLAPEAIALRAAGLIRQWVSDALVARVGA